jgi:hypothetical protein
MTRHLSIVSYGFGMLFIYSIGFMSDEDLSDLIGLCSCIFLFFCCVWPSIVSYQWVLMNSARSCLLNDVQKGLSAGLRGREKLSLNPVR